jgi:hypothetical protein
LNFDRLSDTTDPTSNGILLYRGALNNWLNRHDLAAAETD